jgi:hypothetical protein
MTSALSFSSYGTSAVLRLNNSASCSFVINTLNLAPISTRPLIDVLSVFTSLYIDSMQKPTLEKYKKPRRVSFYDA